MNYVGAPKQTKQRREAGLAHDAKRQRCVVPVARQSGRNYRHPNIRFCLSKAPRQALRQQHHIGLDAADLRREGMGVNEESCWHLSLQNAWRGKMLAASLMHGWASARSD